MADTKQRLAVVLVTVPVDWLTADGEMTEEEGWEVIKEGFRATLSSGFPSPRTGGPTAEFVEWDEVPE